MKKDEALKLALETLENNKQMHYYCEDTWYSCPQHEDGCANDSAGDECNCGADKANAEIDKVITAIKEALAQTEQEPVALPCCGYADASAIKWNPHNQVVQCHNCGQIYTAPPQRTWVGLSVFEINDLVKSTEYEDYQDLVERTEVKLMEKNT